MSRIFYSCIQYIVALGKYNFTRLHDDQKRSKENHILFEIARRRPFLPWWSCYQPEETLLVLEGVFCCFVLFLMLARVTIN